MQNVQNLWNVCHQCEYLTDRFDKAFALFTNCRHRGALRYTSQINVSSNENGNNALPMKVKFSLLLGTYF